MTGLLLQVRLDSSRLPGKALLPLEGETVFHHVLKSLSGVKAHKKIVVTTEDSRDKLLSEAKRMGWELFIGSKEDVLDRYYQAACSYGITRIIRATGDNPLVSSEMANSLVKHHEEKGNDYTGYTGSPVGSGVEVFEFEALEKAWREAEEPFYREHVGPYIWQNRDLFQVEQPKAPEKWLCDGRITLDTKEDYEIILAIYKDLYRGEVIKLEDVITWLKKE